MSRRLVLSTDYDAYRGKVQALGESGRRVPRLRSRVQVFRALNGTVKVRLGHVFQAGFARRSIIPAKSAAPMSTVGMHTPH
jgi:hypothetical protein